QQRAHAVSPRHVGIRRKPETVRADFGSEASSHRIQESPDVSPAEVLAFPIHRWLRGAPEPSESKACLPVIRKQYANRLGRRLCCRPNPLASSNLCPLLWLRIACIDYWALHQSPDGFFATAAPDHEYVHLRGTAEEALVLFTGT